jgi:protein farnesyltransferase subunit beta
VAALLLLLLLGCPEVLDVPLLLHWATQRQGHVESGFNGRTSKLFDGCYSFCQGGMPPSGWGRSTCVRPG